MPGGGAKRWCFTINNPTDADKFWCVDGDEDHPNDILANIQYFILQEERGEQGTLHWQGFLLLKERHPLSWVKRRINERAHWSITRECNERARNYCRKEDTYTGGLRKEWGELKEREVKKRDERFKEACDELAVIKDGYKRPCEITEESLLQPCFISAYKEITADILGPYRPELQIITLVGPPGAGKSYAINKYFPDHGRAIYGNNGVWFQNPTADCIVFEEFCGQIPLTKMLQLLDPYPHALEVKGGMRPAMYTKVIITSNTPPHHWYKTDEAGSSVGRSKAIEALFDRLGYDWGDFRHVRDCGHYIDAPAVNEALGMPVHQYLEQVREMFESAIRQFSQ